MSTRTAGSAPSRQNGLAVIFVDLVAACPLLDAVERSVPRLSAADISRIESLAHDPVECHHWRRVRIATRIVLERQAGPAIRRRDFIIERTGRPVLGDGFPYFNVSHSGNAALIAVSKHAPVGVDLEELRSLSITGERRERLISAANGLTRRSLDPNSDRDVLRAWVQLEAAAKAMGSGIGKLLTETGVVGRHENPGRIATPPTLEVAELEVGSRYVAAVATSAPMPMVQIDVFPHEAAALDDFMRVPGPLRPEHNGSTEN